MSNPHYEPVPTGQGHAPGSSISATEEFYQSRSVARSPSPSIVQSGSGSESPFHSPSQSFSDPPPPSALRSAPMGLPPGAAAPRSPGTSSPPTNPFTTSAPNPPFASHTASPGFPTRDSVASSLALHGYPSSTPPPGFAPYPPSGAVTPAYRTSEYASSQNGLHPAVGGYRDDPSPDPMIPLGNMDVSRDGMGHDMREKNGYPAADPGRRRRRSLLWICLGLLALIALVLVIVLPIYFLLIRHRASSSSGSSSGGSGSGSNPATPTPAPAFNGAITGGSGSVITMEDGTQFTYQNSFGGFWIFDPSDPFNDGAKAQEWSPRLNETWRWGIDQVRGVNLGGWLVTEPFIVPALYEPYQTGDYPAIDEWTLTQAMNKSGNATAMMEEHYSTFITEEDFANIAGAGLNWVRIPIPYWAIETWEGEPFVPKLAWTYFLKAIQWARKYGLRINMDLHTVPGSQNGWNHSGKLGPINFLFGVMGIANAQRTLSYIRTLTEFVSQPEYKNVVQFFGIVNEALMATIGQPELQAFYLEAHDMIRNITGYGEGNGPVISIHDGFASLTDWAGFLSGSDRIFLDTHPYNAFNTYPSPTPFESFIPSPCEGWGAGINTSMSAFGMTAAGEWSIAVNDCGKWVNGVGLGTRWEGTYPGGPTTATGNCSVWDDWPSWNESMKADFQQVALSSMDALQNWFFWTWKIGNSSITGQVESPMWSYSLGLQEGWMPEDPRAAIDYCAVNLSVAMTVPFDGTLSSWMTGGDGAGTIAAAQISSFGAWPITSMNNATGLPYLPPASVAILPQYTPTGAILTMPVPTFTTPSSTQTADAGSGWANDQDTEGYFVPINGCSYPDQWNAQSAPIPTAGCEPTGARRKRELEERIAMPTPPPRV